MTETAADARRRVARVRAVLVGIVVARAALVGAAVALIGVAVRQQAGVDAIVGVIVALGVIWRSRRVVSMERVALWIEEGDPALRYALVTAVDARYPTHTAPPYAGSLLRRAVVRAIGPAVGALAVALVLALAARQWWSIQRVASGDRGGRAAEIASRLTPLVARVTPPEYSHQPEHELREPTSVSSLVGSDVVLSGPGDTNGLRVAIGNKGIATTISGRGWQATMVMPATATVVRLTDRGHDRTVVLTPIPDAPPTVELTAPARDSTMRVAQGTLPLSARASDDIGLSDGYFEVIVTAGEEESGGVKGHTLAIARVSFANARTGTFGGGLVLDALHLNPGDVVSIRAIVRDGNTVSGPGVGTSDTRTFRLATKSEYDSVTVDPTAMLPIDSTYMSQRLIVQATQALLKRMARRPPVARDTVVKTTRVLAGKQEVLKAKVYQLLYGSDDAASPLGQAMSAVEHVLFDTAYHAMGDAAVGLEIADPHEALPRELVALAALDSVRKLQHRFYLRGQPPPIVVNVPRVRMTGTEKPEIGPLTAAVPTDSVTRRIAAWLAAIGRTSRALRGPGVLDSLAIMQAAAYGVSPPLASALGDASKALNDGGDPVPALARARRIVSGSTRVVR